MRASFGVVRRDNRGAPTTHSPAGGPVWAGGGPKLGPSRHSSADSNACLAGEVQSNLPASAVKISVVGIGTNRDATN